MVLLSGHNMSRVKNEGKFVATRYALQCPEFRRMMEHEQTDRIIPAKSSRQLFHVQGNPDEGERKRMNVKGITKILKKMLWPTYDVDSEFGYEKDTAMESAMEMCRMIAIQSRPSWAEPRLATKKSKVIVKSRTARTQVVKSKTKFTGSATARRANPKIGIRKRKGASYATCVGQARGRIVHREIEYYIKYGQQAFRKRYRDPHNQTTSIIHELTRLGLRPVSSELGIYHPELCIGTDIDIVCMDSAAPDPDNNLVFVEIKTGSSTNVTRFNAQMPAPFEEVTNCRMNQALIQVGFAKAIAEHIMGIRVYKSLVMQVEDEYAITLQLETARWWNDSVARRFIDELRAFAILNNLVGAYSRHYRAKVRKKKAAVVGKKKKATAPAAEGSVAKKRRVVSE